MNTQYLLNSYTPAMEPPRNLKQEMKDDALAAAERMLPGALLDWHEERDWVGGCDLLERDAIQENLEDPTDNRNLDVLLLDMLYDAALEEMENPTY